MWRPYARVTFHGKTVNRRTRAMLRLVEADLGYELTITQGSYNTGVGASAGTHDGGGAVDLTDYDWQRKLNAAKRAGFAAWYRRYIPGLWPAHLHLVALADREAAPLAKLQMKAYRAGYDGLGYINPQTGVSAARDSEPWRPHPIPVFTHKRYRRQLRQARRR